MAKQTTSNFSKLFDELEKITKEFETGSVDIDEGIKKFERGLEIANKLKIQLQEVENKIETIKKKFENT
ncbi:exodeoxyribonuclease VII small subunit [Patescibacteria group bacterium]